MSSDAPRLERCPLCGHDELAYQFFHAGTPIVRCAACSLMLRNPQPSDAALGDIYTEHYFLGSDDASSVAQEETHRLKRDTAAGYLDAIERRLGLDPGSTDGRTGRRLLEVGAGFGNLLLEAASRGYDVTGVEYSQSSVVTANERLGAGRVLQGSMGTVDLPDASFDVAVLADVIEHTRDPLVDLRHVWRALRPGGVLFLAVPSLDSWSARLMRERWMEFKLEHLFYFDSATIQTLLFKAGFERVEISAGWKTVSPEYVVRHFNRFPVPLLSPVARVAGSLLPQALLRRSVRVAASGINVLAERSRLPPPVERSHRLSVVVPAFNEHPTFPIVMGQLLAKSIEHVDIEVVVVESNSTDGTRDDVREIEADPKVTVVYEERPRGKGHAVRAGLARATGDYVLIQDADLEYDFNDYESLLEPLRTGRAAFVLGARHGMGGSSWKVRHFTDQALVSQVMNLGHVFFTGLFNVVYGTWLRDPFTMYKVFRRDCLYGLTFESNRFDFDWELVGKLVRAGHRPLEVPVNYQSRSFSEGKKVSFFRDPFTWIRACFKYRFVRLRKK
ncbi:MAG TPA: glycosyltransferase [Vicinamibacterales bacterium]|jgi:SAM-dependent methyltransferase|nr:glycosyltransferase [Vicinamibacterales bacterium]